jgi:hypothetical protein
VLKCKKCNGDMREGKVIAQTVTGAPDFVGDKHAVTMSYGGPGVLIDCLKCGTCGWSVTMPALPFTPQLTRRSSPSSSLLCNDLSERNMTDKELMEAAARAAGYTSYGYGELVGGSPALVLREADFTGMWAPLTDDGDALRLAVQLKMDVKQWKSNSIAVAIWDKHATEDATQDRYAATRRAIVRAAAALDSGHNAKLKDGST